MRGLLAGFVLAVLVFTGVADPLPTLKGMFVLDGRFSEEKWTGSATAKFEGRSATAYLAQTDGSVVLGVLSEHGRFDGRVCDKTAHDDAVYNDDSADLFVALPGQEDFWHVIANVRGAVYDERRGDFGRISVDWDSGTRAAGSYDAQTRRFYIEMRVPLAVFAPADGRLAFCVSSYTRWDKVGTAVWGEPFKPTTWKTFEVGGRYPVGLESFTVSSIAGRQMSSIRLKNRGNRPVTLVGSYAGEPVEWSLRPGDTQTFEAPNTMKKGDAVEVALRLDSDGTRVLEAYRNVVAKPLLKAVPVSDIIWADESLKIRVTVAEKQTEPVVIETKPGVATCTYKDETVVIPYSTDASPWGRK